MRIGLQTPVVTAVPGVVSEWERTAGVEDLVGIVETADELGFDHVTCSEHIAVPVEEAAQRGATYWDPLATLSFLAARTTRLRLVPSVVVVPYHRPLELAKRYGTLDRLSGGRVVLGVGVGSLQAEFDLLGAPWDGRGRVTDERLAELRSAWGQDEYDGMVISPTAVQERLPIWVGGRTARSLRRAVELGDGWMPFGLGAEEIASLLHAAERPSSFEVVLTTGRPLDPAGDRDRTLRTLDRLQAAGATVVTCALAATSAAHHRDQLAALHELVAERR